MSKAADSIRRGLEEAVSYAKGQAGANAMLEDAYRKGLITFAENPTETILPSDPVMTLEELMRDLKESRQDR